VPGLRGHARIRLARFHATAGVIGAALLAVHELERGGRTPPDRDANDRVQPLR
jgi:hypothetical protein